MNVSDLAFEDIVERLRSGRFFLRTGFLTYRIESELKNIAEAIQLLYADFEVEQGEPLADFSVAVTQRFGMARAVRPGACFVVDGNSPFYRFPRRVAPAYLEWGLNWCVHRYVNRYLLLHSATVARADKAMIVVGPSGAGKSTFCAALVAQGWRLLSDEFGFVCPMDRRLRALARPISLKNESISAIRALNRELEIGADMHGTVKGTVALVRPPGSSVARVDEDVEAGWIVFPTYKPGVEAELREVPKARAMIQTAKQCFNYGVLGRGAFEALSDIVERSRCFELEYASLDDAIALFESSESPRLPLPEMSESLTA